MKWPTWGLPAMHRNCVAILKPKQKTGPSASIRPFLKLFQTGAQSGDRTDMKNRIVFNCMRVALLRKNYFQVIMKWFIKLKLAGLFSWGLLPLVLSFWLTHTSRAALRCWKMKAGWFPNQRRVSYWGQDAFGCWFFDWFFRWSGRPCYGTQISADERWFKT